MFSISSISTDDRLRIEKLDSDRFDPTQALKTVTQFYRSHDTDQGRLVFEARHQKKCPWSFRHVIAISNQVDTNRTVQPQEG